MRQLLSKRTSNRKLGFLYNRVTRDKKFLLSRWGTTSLPFRHRLPRASRVTAQEFDGGCCKWTEFLEPKIYSIYRSPFVQLYCSKILIYLAIRKVSFMIKSYLEERISLSSFHSEKYRINYRLLIIVNDPKRVSDSSRYIVQMSNKYHSSEKEIYYKSESHGSANIATL